MPARILDFFGNGNSLDDAGSFKDEATGVAALTPPVSGDTVKMGDLDAVNAPYCDGNTPNGGALVSGVHSILSYSIAGLSTCEITGTLDSADVGGVSQESGNGGTLKLHTVNGAVTGYNTLVANTIVLVGGPFKGGIADLGVYGANQLLPAGDIGLAGGFQG